MSLHAPLNVTISSNIFMRQTHVDSIPTIRTPCKNPTEFQDRKNFRHRTYRVPTLLLAKNFKTFPGRQNVFQDLVVVVIAQQVVSYSQFVQVEEVCDRSQVVPQVLHCKLHRMALTVEQMLYGVWCHSTLRTGIWYAAGDAGLVTVQKLTVTSDHSNSNWLLICSPYHFAASDAILFWL